MLAGLPTAPGEKERERDNGFQHLRAMADLCRKWTARGKGSGERRSVSRCRIHPEIIHSSQQQNPGSAATPKKDQGNHVPKRKPQRLHPRSAQTLPTWIEQLWSGTVRWDLNIRFNTCHRRPCALILQVFSRLNETQYPASYNPSVNS